MYFRHTVTKAVERAAKSPGPEWARINGPEHVDPADVPTPGVQDAPTLERPPTSGAGSGIAAWRAYGASLGHDEAELLELDKPALVELLSA